MRRAVWTLGIKRPPEADFVRVLGHVVDVFPFRAAKRPEDVEDTQDCRDSRPFGVRGRQSDREVEPNQDRPAAPGVPVKPQQQTLPRSDRCRTLGTGGAVLQQGKGRPPLSGLGFPVGVDDKGWPHAFYSVSRSKRYGAVRRAGITPAPCPRGQGGLEPGTARPNRVRWFEGGAPGKHRAPPARAGEGPGVRARTLTFPARPSPPRRNPAARRVAALGPASARCRPGSRPRRSGGRPAPRRRA